MKGIFFSPSLGGEFEQHSSPVGREFESSSVENLKCPGRC